MRRRLSSLVGLAGAMLVIASLAAQPTPFIWPDTLAGSTARAFFAMLADGSEPAVRAFEAAHRTAAALERTPLEERVGRAREIRQRFGAIQVVEITKSSPSSLMLLARAEDGRSLDIELTMDAAEPDKLASVSIGGPGPRRSRTPARPLTHDGIGTVVGKLSRLLRDQYVFPDLGERMASTVQTAFEQGTYDALADEEAFARRLTEDLRAVSRDRHLGVLFEPEADSGPGGGPADPTAAQAEMLPGSIGLLRIDSFRNEPGTLEAIDRAMATLTGASALIVDIRRNGGGDPLVVRYLSSYLLPARTHLNDMLDRYGRVVEEFWTIELPGQRFANEVPVYVLTSAYSFSGAEEFAYNLKSLKRATIVGESTGGGAHPVHFVRVDDRFSAGIPYLRARNPITRTNWEGTGVAPDVAVAADTALDKALELARSPHRLRTNPAASR